MSKIPDASDARSITGRARPPGRPSKLGGSGTFIASLGNHIDVDSPRGYYIDLSSKAVSSKSPPDWYVPGSRRLHVVIIQWGLGCHERYVDGDGEDWLEAARWVADHLIEIQEDGGRHDGGWVQHFPYKHTYRLTPPWLSGMAQGEGASLLVRIHAATGEDRYAEAALRALRPMRVGTAAGGVAGNLDSAFLPEEYPTDPASHVLNGAIFGLFGVYDVAAALGDEGARELADEGISTLAGALDRYDTGYWSRYDLFPHPVTNLANPMYHGLHTDQLRAMSLIDDDPRFPATVARFERYATSRVNRTRALATKAVFRVLVPRNRWLAYRLPWTRG